MPWPRASVVVAALNEAGNLPHACGQLARTLVIVGWPSTDVPHGVGRLLRRIARSAHAGSRLSWVASRKIQLFVVRALPQTEGQIIRSCSYALVKTQRDSRSRTGDSCGALAEG
jgi:hypothetical protein